MIYLAQAELFFLVLVRTTSFFVTAPFFGIRGVPPLVKAGLGLLVSMLLFPVLPAGQPTFTGTGAYALAVLNESMAGLALGYLATLIFSAIQVAGQLLDLHMGLGMASLFDPQNATSTTLMGQFFAILGLLLFFQLDGHHTLLLALQESFRLLPLGGVHFDGNIAWAVVKLFSGMFSLAVRIAAPVIVVLLIADLALSLIARTVPQLNVFILGFPLKIGLGLLVLIAILPILATVFHNLFSQMEHDLALLLRSWPR
ncbi:flagellar biosynthetic protein FliR [Neomoorella mulderi]|uniref:Flagellar biosynthetic protein FliR n=1 Tax=Moorella mulderi DSM 14980 TaxID=1122241 RepID=A0A151AYM9_9FIRM|nr:flagellar biosynthetic protein FliR [Moorella mulderi]KYH32652.1 flagellar biosynthetic protein FliR [Moorella mulderi DSM 14980]